MDVVLDLYVAFMVSDKGICPLEYYRKRSIALGGDKGPILEEENTVLNHQIDKWENKLMGKGVD